MTRSTAAAFALLLCSIPAFAQPALGVGDRMPDLDLEHWLRAGDAPETWIKDGVVDDWSGGLTVVEFWASWCGPCIAGFDELSTLQESHASDGVRVIAVTYETPTACVEFMLKPVPKADDRRQGDRMRFAIASDPDNSVWEEVLLASGGPMIPRALLVNSDGVIEWLGHPKTHDLSGAVEAVLAGSWDRDAYKRSYATDRVSVDAFEDAMAGGDWDAAETLAGDDWERLTRIAFGMLLSKQGRDDSLLRRAEGLANRAMRQSNGEQAFVYHVLARASANRSDYESAARLQRRAVELDDGKGAEWYTKALEQYELRLRDG